jgi:hypothetical protein
MTGALMVALPCAVAIFPQKASLAVSNAEPEFQGLTNAQGQPIQHLFFNRGL